jgi:uncharacterized membrane protein YphA (DoxX/SURF4 family)
MLWSGIPDLPGWVFSIPVALILLVCAGLLTRFASITCAITQCATIVFVASTQPVHGVIAAMASIALSLLGPGAYSLDAWLFGRRIVELPRPARRSHEIDYPNE